MISIDAIELKPNYFITKGKSVSGSSNFISKICLIIFTVAATSLAAWFLVAAGFPSPEALGILFVIPVLVAAVFYGLLASLMTSFFSMLAYNFVLLAPVWHIALWEAENITKMFALGFVAIVASALSERNRKLTNDAVQRERIISGVYALSQDMLGIANIADMLRAAEEKLSILLGCDAKIILKNGYNNLDAAKKFCIDNNTPVGSGTKHFSDSANLYLPLSANEFAIGLLCIASDVSKRFSYKILATLTAQTASALEKARLAEAHERKLLDAEREKFISALLSSVSHDFKTPLVTIIGSFSSLKEMSHVKDHSDSREIVIGGLGEAQKLNRFINNLVEISRLESGLEVIRKEPVLLRDIIASALKTLQPLIGKQQFSIYTPTNFPLLNVNSELFELIFLNLLENSIKYGPAQGEVKIIASFDEESVTIDIDDDGDGIPKSEREAIFVKFYRSKQGDSKIAGTGLGLYICREIIEAHGGTIAAIDPHDGKGACVRLELPKEALIPIDIEQEIEEGEA